MATAYRDPKETLNRTLPASMWLAISMPLYLVMLGRTLDTIYRKGCIDSTS